MVNEIVLAIDPFLCKIEQILLWKNKLKSCAVFTFCHFLFWLFLNYNIRTYCTISCVFLCLHLLDAYRTKKRRELIRLQNSNKNINESLSSLGRFIIYFNTKLAFVYGKLNKLKRRNRFLYFLAMFIFWSMTAIIGAKIQGFYLSYILFWMVFFIPAIIHFDIPRKLLSRALPLLEQLDHSMKYERRSILDKSELLVDVKHKNNDEEDEAEEDEYLKSFQLGDLDNKDRRRFENLEDEESLFSERTEDDDDNDDDEGEDIDGNEDEEEENEEIIEEVFEYKTFRNESDRNNTNSYQNNNEIKFTKLISKKSSVPVKTSDIEFDVFDVHGDSVIGDEFMPNVNMSALSNSLLQTSNDESFYSDTRNNNNNNKILNIDSGNKVLKKGRFKNRPSLLQYYGDSNAISNNTKKTPQNEHDIDETFDFLDEELDKY